jgi:hypothetical protein
VLVPVWLELWFLYTYTYTYTYILITTIQYNNILASLTISLSCTHTIAPIALTCLLGAGP